jgi:hypothetical protein
MRKYDLISGFFWGICAVLIIIGSLRLPVGTVANPGPGFLPLILGGLLGVLSLILVFIALLKGLSEKKAFWVNKSKWYKVVVTILAMLIYAMTLAGFGFLLPTFLLMFVFFKALGNLNLKRSFGGALFVSLFFYFLFKILLNVELPTGIGGV